MEQSRADKTCPCHPALATQPLPPSLDEGIIPYKFQDDALHIALATFNDADALVSWNFRHMVKLKTIRGVNGINRMLGFKELEILTPQSWIQEDNNE